MISEEEKLFREWLNEQKAHAKIIDDDKELHGEYKVILMERSTEPYGTWKLARFKKPTEQTQVDTTKQISSDKISQSTNSVLTVNKTLSPEIMKIIRDYPYNLEIQSSSKVKVANDLPKSEWEKVRKEFIEKGWKWDWKEKSFISEGAKA